MAMTITFEGSIFVNATFSAEMTITDYVTQLVPDFNQQQIDEAVALYTNVPGLDTVNDQAIAIMGECEHHCHALIGFYISPCIRQRSSSAPHISFCKTSKGPGSRPNSLFLLVHMVVMLCTTSRAAGMSSYSRLTAFPTKLTHLHNSEPPFANPEFDASFAGAFTAFAKFNGNPNIHPVPDVITPHWDLYTDGDFEMLFNRTEDFQPDIRPVKTDPALLNRCE